jgi:hypothetical protein
MSGSTIFWPKFSNLSRIAAYHGAAQRSGFDRMEWHGTARSSVQRVCSWVLTMTHGEAKTGVHE